MNVESKTFTGWFKFPTTEPKKESASFTLVDARVRVSLLMNIYNWIHTQNISKEEVKERLKHYHDSYVDFESEEWRERELGAFWASIYMCAFSEELKNRWIYSEKFLFEFRIETYFDGRDNRVRLIKNNASLLVDFEFVKNVPRNLKPKGFDPERTHYFRVNWESAYSLIKDGRACLSGGKVYIDWRHIDSWIWCQIENNFSASLRDLCPKSGDIEKDGMVALETSTVYKEFMLIQKCTKEIDSTMDIERELNVMKKKRDRMTNSGPCANIVDIEDLTLASKDNMPACQAMHIYQAIENKSHPKYEARKSFTMFALEAGHDVEEVEMAMFLLWKYDLSITENRVRFPNGFDMKSYLRGCDVVSGLDKAMKRSFEPITAYGCGGTIKRNMCPFSAETLDQKFFRWMGYKDDVIKEIEDTKSAERNCSKRCTLAFSRKHPFARELVIKHPNMYYRESGRAKNFIRNKKLKERS